MNEDKQQSIQEVEPLELINISEKYKGLEHQFMTKKLYKGTFAPKGHVILVLYIYKRTGYISKTNPGQKTTYTSVKMIPGGLDEITLSHVHDSMIQNLCTKYPQIGL